MSGAVRDGIIIAVGVVAIVLSIGVSWYVSRLLGDRDETDIEGKVRVMILLGVVFLVTIGLGAFGLFYFATIDKTYLIYSLGSGYLPRSRRVRRVRRGRQTASRPTKKLLLHRRLVVPLRQTRHHYNLFYKLFTCYSYNRPTIKECACPWPRLWRLYPSPVSTT